MTAWVMSAEVLEPGWFEIPDLPEDELAAWSSEIASALEESWAIELTPEGTLQVRNDLERAQRLRPADANLTLAYWPAFSDIFFGLTVIPGRAPLAEEWQVEGYEFRRYEAERLGVGVECINVDTISEDSGRYGNVQIVTAEYVFVQGARSVTVSVDPQPTNYFLMMRSGIEQFLQSLEIRQEGGASFRGEAVDFDQVAMSGEAWCTPE